MRVLVTGVAGFVGSSLATELLRRGHRVVGIDSLTDYYDPSLKHGNLRTLHCDNFEFHHNDLNTMDLSPILADVDVVFHQAGQPGVRKSWGSEFQSYVEANVQATQRLLESAIQAPSLKRFVYASSSSVYGESETYPTTEETRPRPMSPYGVTKLAAEHLCTLYGRSFGVPTVSLRYFTVYGPRQRPDMAFARFVRASITGEPVSVYGDGSQIRDFTFISDVVQANILAAERTSSPGTVLNISGGSQISVNEALSILADLRGEPLNVTYTASLAGDVRRTSGENRLAKEILDWSPRVPVSSGLALHREWMLTEHLSPTGVETHGLRSSR